MAPDRGRVVVARDESSKSSGERAKAASEDEGRKHVVLPPTPHSHPSKQPQCA